MQMPAYSIEDDEELRQSGSPFFIRVLRRVHDGRARSVSVLDLARHGRNWVLLIHAIILYLQRHNIFPPDSEVSRLVVLEVVRGIPWRPIAQLHSQPTFRINNMNRLRAVLAHGAGRTATNGRQCTYCAQSSGAFQQCVFLNVRGRLWQSGACTNCVYMGRANQCSARGRKYRQPLIPTALILIAFTEIPVSSVPSATFIRNSDAADETRFAFYFVCYNTNTNSLTADDRDWLRVRLENVMTRIVNRAITIELAEGRSPFGNFF